MVEAPGIQLAVEPAAAKDQEPPESTKAEPGKVEAQPVEPPAVVERPKPVITSEPPSRPAPTPPSPPPAHKTEVKPLVRKTEAGLTKAPGADDGATAEELRRTKSSPLVRKIAEEHGIDIKQLEGTGMSGRVTKNDILSFIDHDVIEDRSRRRL